MHSDNNFSMIIVDRFREHNKDFTTLVLCEHTKKNTSTHHWHLLHYAGVDNHLVWVVAFVKSIFLVILNRNRDFQQSSTTKKKYKN